MKRKRATLDIEGSIDNLLATPELRSLYPAAMGETGKETERAARILLACEHVFAHRDADPRPCRNDPCRALGLSRALTQLVDARDSPPKLAWLALAQASYEASHAVAAAAGSLEAARRLVAQTLERERLGLAERWTVARSGSLGEVVAAAHPPAVADEPRSDQGTILLAAAEVLEELRDVAELLRCFDQGLRDLSLDPDDHRSREERSEHVVVGVAQALFLEDFRPTEIAALILDGEPEARGPHRVRDRVRRGTVDRRMRWSHLDEPPGAVGGSHDAGGDRAARARRFVSAAADTPGDDGAKPPPSANDGQPRRSRK
jgi:hypothetical protein